MKTILFDTSVLVAGMVTAHANHLSCVSWFRRAIEKEFGWAVAAHSLAECYAVLTTLPLSPKISPSIAKHLIEDNIEKHAKIISLTARDYTQCVKTLSERGLSGGIVYDAIIYHAAKKTQAAHLLTLNLRDFSRFADENHDFVITA